MNILVVGDSFSADSGFVEPEGKVWHHHVPSHHHVTNLSAGGQSNYKIFIKVCTELATNPNYDLVVVQWTSILRLTLTNNADIYEKSVPLGINSDFGFPDIHKQWVTNFVSPRTELSEFLTLLSVMSSFLKMKNMNYVFIKLVDNFFNDLTHTTWRNNCSDEFLDTVLRRASVPDGTINEFYVPLREQYLQMEKDTANHWMNLHSSSWVNLEIDKANDNRHVGVLTNKLYYDNFVDFIKKFEIYL